MLRYALKELTRRKSRSLLSIFGIVVCTALLSSVLCISRAMRNAAREPFETANADESASGPVAGTVFKTADGRCTLRGGFDSHALSQ